MFVLNRLAGWVGPVGSVGLVGLVGLVCSVGVADLVRVAVMACLY